MAELTVYSYLRLTPEQREHVRVWIQDHGVNRFDVFAVIPGEGWTTFRRYIRDYSTREFCLDETGEPAWEYYMVLSMSPLRADVLADWVRLEEEADRG